MNATGLETLDNIWDLFETSLRMDSIYLLFLRCKNVCKV